jgi:hypothetical protein
MVSSEFEGIAELGNLGKPVRLRAYQSRLGESADHAPEGMDRFQRTGQGIEQRDQDEQPGGKGVDAFAIRRGHGGRVSWEEPQEPRSLL